LSSEAQRLPATAPHGVYVYSVESRSWIPAGRSALLGDGVYVIYFDNAKCGACRKFDDYWFPFVEEVAPEGRATFVIVLCEWFAKRCSSDDARDLFKEFDVHVSPTVVFLRREGGKNAKVLKGEGVMPPQWLAITYQLITQGARREA